VSNVYDRRLRMNQISCDEKGCLANFETIDFRRDWRQKTEEGWAYVPEYEDGVSISRHYCPEHARKFDRNN
jgi:hypothetical protein